MVYHVFSDPVVLSECRAEVERLVQVDDNDVHTVDLANVKSLCPILLSIWQETLHYMHISIAARVVVEDIIFNTKYLLKKSATIITVAPVQHTNILV